MSLAPLMSIACDVGAPVEIGDAGAGLRRFIPILGGTVSGAVEGIVLPGADWQTAGADGVIELSAHYALEARDGSRIEVKSVGVRAGPAEVLAALGRGERVDPSLYYFRTSMRFTTGATAYLRLNSLLAIARAERLASRVLLTVEEVL